MTTHQNSKLKAEIEALTEVFAAINRNDVPAALQYFDPQIERIEFLGLPQAGSYRGLAELKAHLSQARATWAEGSCDPERFLIAGDKVIVFLHARVRLKDKVEWIDGRFADVFTFCNGTILHWRTFSERQEALEWVGVRDPDAS